MNKYLNILSHAEWFHCHETNGKCALVKKKKKKLISNKPASPRANHQKTKCCCLCSTSLHSCLQGSGGKTLQRVRTGFCFPINTNPSQASSPNPCNIAAKQSPSWQCLNAEHNKKQNYKIPTLCPKREQNKQMTFWLAAGTTISELSPKTLLLLRGKKTLILQTCKT